MSVTMLVLDLTWIGIVAKPIYDKLGPLKRETAFIPAAMIFYVMYIGVAFLYAVRGASSIGDAAGRGAALGFVAYATYELTNWAVLKAWPVVVVPVDIVWGVVLTATVAAVGRWAYGIGHS